MTGLHVCKPNNTPQVGQVKSFIINGDRIKSKKTDEGGQNYKITAAVQSETYKDSYGNVGFNLTIEPANGGQPTTQIPMGSPVVQHAMSKDDYWSRKEERDIEASQRMNRCHAQGMALQYWTLINAGGGLTPEHIMDAKKLRLMIDFFQRDSRRTAPDNVEQDPASSESEEVF